MDRDPGNDPDAAAAQDPAAAPRAVLTRLIEALAAGARPGRDDGIDVVYDLASDALRARVGGPEDLRRAFHNSLNRVWLGHRGADVVALERRGEAARADVVVFAVDGARVRFTVTLVRSLHGERAGRWLLSGLAREGVDL